LYSDVFLAVSRGFVSPASHKRRYRGTQSQYWEASGRQILVVSLNELGQIYVDKQPVPTDKEFRQRLRDYRQKNPEGLMALYASANASYNQVVQVLDLLRQEGGERVALATILGKPISRLPSVRRHPPPPVFLATPLTQVRVPLGLILMARSIPLSHKFRVIQDNYCQEYQVLAQAAHRPCPDNQGLTQEIHRTGSWYSGGSQHQYDSRKFSRTGSWYSGGSQHQYGSRKFSRAESWYSGGSQHQYGSRKFSCAGSWYSGGS
jgi:hypothetical protein